MIDENKKFNKLDTVSLAFLIFITLFGFLIRVLGVLNSAFPLNDGGLFYMMIEELQANHFALPSYTSYNNGMIPFAYPPFGFYVAGFLSFVFNWSVLEITRWLPAIVSTFTIPAFYFLAKEILKSKEQAVIAVFIFTFIPRSFDWIVMGGGVTRAWGYLFALLAIRQLYRFYTQEENNIFSVTIFSTLVVLTHPEAAVHTFLAALFFFFYFSHSFKIFFRSVRVGLSVLALSGPWWLIIIYRHSFAPFSAAMLSSQQNNATLFSRFFLLFKFSFTDEPNLTLIGVLGLLGIFTLFAQKRYFLPLWLGFVFLLEPRSASLYVVTILALSSAVLFDEILFDGFKKLSQNLNSAPFPSPKNWAEEMLNNKASLLLFAFVFIYGIYSSYATIWTIQQTWTLDVGNQKAFAWVVQNTESDSQFLLLTSADAMLDPVSEWFPAITERVSLATVFGYEWFPDGRFGERIDQYNILQSCLSQDEECAERWARENRFDYRYIYFSHQSNSSLVHALENSIAHSLIYQSDDIQIFEKRE